MEPMPEGYTLVDDYGNGRRFHVLLKGSYQYNALQNSAGKRKLFHSQAKAEEYARKHAAASLPYDKVVQ